MSENKLCYFGVKSMKSNLKNLIKIKAMMLKMNLKKKSPKKAKSKCSKY
jgi:hypothetical protein